MSETLGALRSQVARGLGMHYSGTVTAGTANTVEDTSGLARFHVDDELIGALLYLPDSDEARWITDYSAVDRLLTVEFAFGTAPSASDPYEIFRGPLSLDQWTLAINDAIASAWPEVYGIQRDEKVLPPRATYVNLKPECWGVIHVHITHQGHWADFGHRVYPRHLWWLDTTDVPQLHFSRPLSGLEGRLVIISYKYRYPALAAADDTTELGLGYLLAQARANAYQMLIGETGGASQADQYQRLLVFWQQQAQERRAALARDLAELTGLLPPKEGGKNAK